MRAGRRVRTLDDANARIRCGLLILLVVGTIACVILANTRIPSLLWLRLGAAVLLSMLLSFAQLRHMALAALVGLAPLSGVAPLLLILPAGTTMSVIGLAWALGLAASLFLGEAVAEANLKGDATERAVVRVLDGNIRLLLAMLATAIAPVLALSLFGSSSELRALTLASACVLGSVSFVLPLGASLLTFDEDFIGRANRAREFRARLLAPLMAVAGRRYGFSVAGIACVLSAIMIFGAKAPQALVTGSFGIALLVTAAVMASSSWAALSDWRRSLAVLMAAGLANLAAIWMFFAKATALTLHAILFLSAANAIGLAIQLLIGVAAASDLSTEDDVVSGSECAIETRSLPAIAAGVAGIAATLVLIPDASVLWATFAVSVAASACSAIVFQPAFAITLEGLWPRKATIAERYRLH